MAGAETEVETAVEAAAEERTEVAQPQPRTKPKAKAHAEDAAGLFKTVCRKFMDKKCNKANCRFVHDAKLCAHFWRTGECRYGDECRRNHFVRVPDDKSAPEMERDAKSAPESKQDAKKKDRKPKGDKKSTASTEDKPDAKKEESSTAKKEDKPTAKQEDKLAAKKSKKKKSRATKKNTECFEPRSQPVDLRLTFDLGGKDDRFSTPLTARDVVLVSNLFSDFKKGELYAKLVAELDSCGVPRERLLKMWHGNDKLDGTHLIVDDRSSWKAKCPTFKLVTDRVQRFFSLSIKATRFNWYKDTSQWKPFHFDAAAVKPEIAAIQNFTVGISFGATRDAAFEHAETKTVLSVPQPDGCVYAFARDTNIIWRHGILQDAPVRDEGRISVIAWGWVDGMADVPADVLAS